MEVAKKQYKNDKKRMTDEEFIKGNPDEYKRQKVILDQAKVQIEDKIDRMNKKVEKIKLLEKKL